MYSVTTGSLMRRVLFSSSIAYPLPILISLSVEYQLPIPRPPISRFPTALMSAWLPALTPGTVWPGATVGWVFPLEAFELLGGGVLVSSLTSGVGSVGVGVVCGG